MHRESPYTGTRKSTFEKVLGIAFYVMAALYAFLMLDLLFRINIISSGSAMSPSYNVIPFNTIRGYLGGSIRVSQSQVIQNVLGNMIIFIPYGLYLQALLKDKGFGKSLLILLVSSLSVEVIQFAFSIGAADIDDVILNVCGGIIGIVIYKVLMSLLRSERKTRMTIAIVSLIIGVPIVIMYGMVWVNRVL